MPPRGSRRRGWVLGKVLGSSSPQEQLFRSQPRKPAAQPDHMSPNGLNLDLRHSSPGPQLLLLQPRPPLQPPLPPQPPPSACEVPTRGRGGGAQSPGHIPKVDA